MAAGAETVVPLYALSSSFEDSLHKVALAENPLIPMEAVAEAAARREGRPTPGTPDQASPGQLRPAPLGDPPAIEKGRVSPILHPRRNHRQHRLERLPP